MRERLNESFTLLHTNLSGPYAWDYYIDFTLALGNVSSCYQLCYNVTEYNYDSFRDFLKTYNTTKNYLTFLLPNILSYAFEFDLWAQKIEELEIA